MGFYGSAQLVRDARDHGVEVLPVSVNHSEWDCTLEARGDGELALRLGLRQIKGMKKEDAEQIAKCRGNGYPDVESLWLRAGIKPEILERLAEADAFVTIGVGRRDALWAARALRSPGMLPLFGADGEGVDEPKVTLPTMTLGQEVIEDYLSMRLSLRAHPLEILRRRLPESMVHERLSVMNGRVSVTGLVITRQRPATSSGVIFLTLEDETGTSNIVVWRRIYERYRNAIIGGRLLRVTGRIEREGQVVHVIAEKVEDLSLMLASISGPGRIAGNGPPQPSARHPREQAKRLFPSRDFH